MVTVLIALATKSNQVNEKSGITHPNYKTSKNEH